MSGSRAQYERGYRRRQGSVRPQRERDDVALADDAHEDAAALHRGDSREEVVEVGDASDRRVEDLDDVVAGTEPAERGRTLWPDLGDDDTRVRDVAPATIGRRNLLDGDPDRVEGPVA